MATSPIVLYNVQRLLSLNGSPIARALDATAANGWTASAYKAKVSRLGAVLRDATAGRLPAVLVLVEVEDAKGLKDVVDAAGWSTLVAVDPLAEQVSGWDVAIAYDPAVFPGGVTHSVSHVFNNRFNTRDLLLARLGTASGAELVVMATHWPSRKVSDAQPERYAAATYCDAVVEQTLKFLKQDLLSPSGQPQLPSRTDLMQRWLTPLLIAGDFNDEPWDASVRALASSTAVRRSVTAMPTMPTGSTVRSVAAYLSRTPRLFNPTWALDHNDPPAGTYYYDSNWHRLDQMLFSAGLLGSGTPRYVDGSMRVHSVRTVTVDGQPVDVTTPAGYPVAFDPKGMRGVSDHLPLVAELEF